MRDLNRLEQISEEMELRFKGVFPSSHFTVISDLLPTSSSLPLFDWTVCMLLIDS